MGRQKSQQKLFKILVFFQSGVKREISVRASSKAVAEQRALKRSGAEGLVHLKHDAEAS